MLDDGEDVPEDLENNKSLDSCSFGFEEEDPPSIYIKASMCQATNGGDKIQLPNTKPSWTLVMESYCKRNNINMKKIGWYLSPFLG
jgi:hypothetical protein